MFWLKILNMRLFIQYWFLKKKKIIIVSPYLLFSQNRGIMNKNDIQASVHTRTVFNSEQCDQIEKKLSKIFLIYYE